jgi:hypothetical protein
MTDLTSPERFAARAEAKVERDRIRGSECASCVHAIFVWKTALCRFHDRTRRLECLDDRREPMFEPRGAAA